MSQAAIPTPCCMFESGPKSRAHAVDQTATLRRHNKAEAPEGFFDSGMLAYH